jgi:hypothetical protein
VSDLQLAISYIPYKSREPLFPIVHALTMAARNDYVRVRSLIGQQPSFQAAETRGWIERFDLDGEQAWRLTDAGQLRWIDHEQTAMEMHVDLCARIEFKLARMTAILRNVPQEDVAWNSPVPEALP